ncbi:hypothetical protein HYFRA_00006230 [Hymenoscyphus fraxineus]|uniref:Uncharacterized protein n=1 Tax=Hymenoscyphus fraxineus TaxID=746836 RepID=A0A9N9L777_9HELO|nr:hypothetical protein HYFRA_00006230 [Hymenoscyphus fraxineus]
MSFSRYLSVLSDIQERALRLGLTQADFAQLFDHFHAVALQTPNLSDDGVKLATEDLISRHLWPNEVFSGKYETFPPAPISAIPPNVVLFNRQPPFAVAPLLGYASAPQYGTDSLGLPYWSQILPLPSLQHFEREIGCAVTELEEVFAVKICLHEANNRIMIWPEHAPVRRDLLAREHIKMDRFYKFIYHFGREVRGLNSFWAMSDALNSTAPSDSYLTKYFAQESKGELDWATPDPPRYNYHPFLAQTSQHIRDTQVYRSQFRKNDNETIYNGSGHTHDLPNGVFGAIPSAFGDASAGVANEEL